MKFIKHIGSFILTLSLSAISIYSSHTIYTGVYLLNSEEYCSAELDVDNSTIESPTDLPKDEHVEVFTSNDQMIYLTEPDIYLMSQIVYAESKGEPFQGKVAVASVILNRVLDPKFPNTIKEVIFQPYAFSCVVDGSISVEPSEDCVTAVYEAIAGSDPTGEALFFYNPEISTCSWMISVEKYNTIPIGQHLFFTL
jgi:N-acetylmuramoyl-L-alanine amidase